MTSQSKQSGAERRFLFIHNQLNEVQSLREEAHLYRKLVTQVTDNIVSQGWDPLSGLEAVETYLEAAGKIVDDQKGINNYSHESLNNSDLSNFPKFEDLSHFKTLNPKDSEQL